MVFTLNQLLRPSIKTILEIQPLTSKDLPQLEYLQPEGWLSIIPYFEFYTANRFCYPIKYIDQGKLVGIGSSIVHKNTAWLAHIIVSPDYRHKGIGTTVTTALLKHLEPMHIESILLLATPMGESVYRRLGFTYEIDYIFLKDGQLPKENHQSIKPFQNQYMSELLKFDQHVFGENRGALLRPHLADGYIILNSDDQLEAFHLPTLGEGLIVSRTPESGLALLKTKTTPYIAVPEKNKTALDFLLKNRFIDFRRGKRMWLGKPIEWHPELVYSRIGGNLG